MPKEHKKEIWIREVVKYFWKVNMSQKTFFFLSIFGITLASVAGLALPIYFAQMIDVITKFVGVDKTASMIALVGIVGMVALMEIWRQVWRRTFGCSIIPLEVRNIKKIMIECFEYLHRHSYRFFSNNFSWSLVKKVNKIVGAYENVTDIFMFDIWRLLVIIPFIIITVALRNRELGAVFLAFIIVYWTFQYFFYKWNVGNEIEANRHDSKITGELSDTISNNFNILTFASLPREIKKFMNSLNLRGKVQRKTWYRGEIIHAMSGFLLLLFEVGALYVTVRLWWLSLISAGSIVLIQTYVLRLFDQMSSLDSTFKRLNKAIWESAEMLEILETPHEIQDHSKKTLKISQGEIAFENVNFEYVSKKPVFQWLTFNIKPGEKVGIVGASWSGKTTIIKLLFRFFDIQNGHIMIDDQDITKVTQDSLRDAVSMVPQEPILFHRTLKENISYGKPDATDEEIIAAAKMARCHEFIMNFKEGYETLVGERGIKLSGWERQRVAIARAILENKGILVMDEATSSLDSESEQLIQEAMDVVLKNKTAIVIAHRLSTIMKMDRIIVMEKGKIIETGSHKELLVKDKGIYKKLRDIQSGGFIE